MTKICVVYSHSKVGDLIWQLPYIKSISEYHKDSVTLIVHEYTQAKKILKNCEYINLVEYNQFRKKLFYWIDIFNLYLFLKNKKFTHVYILDKINRPAISARLAKVKNIIGPGIKQQKKYLTCDNFLSDEDWKLNYSEQSQKILKINNIPIFNKFPDIQINLERNDILPKIKNINDKIISFGIDSGEEYKMWYEDYFLELAEKLQKIIKFNKVYLICSKKNRPMSNYIIKKSKYNLFEDASDLDLVNVMAILKKSEIFVGNNSGPLNLSAALGTKSFGLIANDAISELKFSKIIPITPSNYKDNVWNRDRKGMKELTVQKVYNDIISNLNNNK
tara:strand:- start:49 stop:1047 length:999 start_codon:yes stop_codon:yes gene_type:complete